MKQSEIKFTVTLDDDKMPEKIAWSASDTNAESTSKAVMIALWDTKEKIRYALTCGPRTCWWMK
jgi:hypothetical protein